MERCVRDSQRRLPESVGCAWLEPEARVIRRWSFQKDERHIAPNQQLEAATDMMSEAVCEAVLAAVEKGMKFPLLDLLYRMW